MCIFESTIDKEVRDSGGMHYTTPDNIHRAIDPLFLEQLETMRMRYYLTYANTGNKTNDEVWEKASMAMDKAITIVKGGGVK